MLRTIRLYGSLSRKFGREFHYDVASPAEAVAALKATLPGFEAYLVENSEPGYHLFTGRDNLGIDQLSNPTGDVIRIVPAVVGAKAGTLQVILGAILVVVGVFTSWAGGTTLIQLGAGLIISGLATMLFAPPKPKSASDRENPLNRPSYSFDGPVNTAQQGNPVGVGYGRMIIGSQVISAGLYVESL